MKEGWKDYIIPEELQKQQNDLWLEIHPDSILGKLFEEDQYLAQRILDEFNKD